MENLNKGEAKQQWSILKKVSATLTTITLAPFLFPPFLIFSTIAFALASPLLLYFTSYVCTNKILRSLLPLRVPQQVYKEKEWVEEDEQYKEEEKDGEYGNIEIEGDESKEKENEESTVEKESKEKEGEEAKPKKKGKGKKSSGTKKTQV